MEKKYSEPAASSPDQTAAQAGAGVSFMVKKRPAIFGVISFLILSLAVAVFIYQRYQVILADKKQEGYHVLNAVKNKLQQTLAHGLSAAKTISFFIDSNGVVNNFDAIAPAILGSSKYIDAIQLVPGGVIRYVYPLAGNEKSLGYDILSDSTRNKEAYKAIEKNEFFFAGPLQLKQGGMAVVGRLPVFRKGKFWGFSAVIISVNSFLKAAGIDSSANRGFYFQLSKLNPYTNREEFFLPQNRHYEQYKISIDLPDGEWKLSATPANPNDRLGDIILFAILGLLFASMGGFFVYTILKRPQHLDELVHKRTAQLKESEENYKALFNKSPLPLCIYDRDSLRFLEVNEAAANLYGYSNDEFLVANINTIWPGNTADGTGGGSETSSDFRDNDDIVSHFKKTGEEILVMIFTRDIAYKGHRAKLLLVMDVSEKVAIERSLVKSEEKYRTLIEQATDGIILYSFDGTIHEFNKSAYLITGYTREEFQQLKLTDLLVEKKVIISEENAERIKEGINTTFNRRVKRKDGTEIEAELNAKLLPDGKIIAIVRDITGRIKVENEIRGMNRQLRELSGHLENIREEERTNIAREIHDELGQQLTGLKMDLFWLNRKLADADEDIKEKTVSVLQVIDGTIKTVRKIATDLRPSILDDLGLVAAMEWQSTEFEKRSDIKVNLVNNIGDLAIQPNVATTLFRIYQELLTNVARHANAGHVSAVIGITGDQLYFSVADNGKGFDAEEVVNRRTLGLMGIKERTLLIEGSYDISTKPGEGTKVMITVPLHKAIAKK